MGREAETSGRSGMADDYLQWAGDDRDQADVLREAPMALKWPDPGEADIAGYEAQAQFERSL